WREYLVSLCGRSMNQGVDLWVGTLPVFHLCMGPRPPGRKPRIQPENIWAALEGLSFSEFREKRAHEKKLLQLMVKKKYLLSVDEDLFRSWFSLLPLSSLAAYLQEFSDYLTRFPARVLDCLLGTRYRLQGHKDVNKNLEVRRLQQALEGSLGTSAPAS
ncbi:PREDICTED: E3 ubiquitin-protein ligase RNF213-like, partial [Myotis brandtii]|uniref:E3 ubiquitin-protein ligase RNF213-like n=1 Tax=Myotis brandtii TaxID=109478 RepID=UPI00070424E7